MEYINKTYNISQNICGIKEKNVSGGQSLAKIADLKNTKYSIFGLKIRFFFVHFLIPIPIPVGVLFHLENSTSRN